jgi:hypothetical protein
MHYRIRLTIRLLAFCLLLIVLNACQRAPAASPQPTRAPTVATIATIATVVVASETPAPSETLAEASATEASAILDTAEVIQTTDLSPTAEGTQPGFSINPFGPDGLLAVTASASAPAKVASPTHGITVTPPAGSRIITYSRTAAQISGRAKYFLDLRIANQTKRASIELRKGLMVYTWQGTLYNQPNVVQRIVLVPRPSPNGLLSLEIGSATQNNVKIDFSKTVLGADPGFRSAALISLIIDYQSIVAGKPVKTSSSILLSKCDISPARIVIDRIMPK